MTGGSRIARVDDVDGFAKSLTTLLEEHAREAGHAFDNRPFAFRAEEDGDLLGGISGYMLYDWGLLRYLVLAPAARGRGIGERLIAEAERHCAAEGARGMFVDTYGFQAPGFYPLMGYLEMGRLTAGMPDRDRHYLRKDFTETPAGERAR